MNERSKIDPEELIGMRVWNVYSHSIGIIKDIRDGILFVDYHGEISKYSYPSAFAGTLELEDESIQEKIQSESVEASFDDHIVMQ